MPHSYPTHLARVLCDSWKDGSVRPEGLDPAENYEGEPLPDPGIVERLLSICYQASLLREEEHPVTFRLLLRDPERFDPGQGPPMGLHRLLFTFPRPCDEQELRRLSPAADFYRTLIGVRLDERRNLQIWGLVSSGPRWVQPAFGGRKQSEILPPCLVIRASGPGRIAVCKGSIAIATLSGGRVNRPTPDVMESLWLPRLFTEVRNELMGRFDAVRAESGNVWPTLNSGFIKTLTQQAVHRMVSMIRNSRIGGTIILLPQERAVEAFFDNTFMTIKYKFIKEEPRQRLRTLIVGIMTALAEEYGHKGCRGMVGWKEYVESSSDGLALLEEGIFEVAHLIAGFSAVDGAVVLTRNLEILGFGGEILGNLHKVPTVARAFDAEGKQLEIESTERVGTRHRSVYRLCDELHDVLGIVISKDGNARFVMWKDGIVTCWDQVATSVLDI